MNSPTKLTIELKTPIAGQFYNLLANGETFVVSPTAVQSGTPLNEKPVGAGPFTLESYTPERSAKFVKNPNYFQAKKIKVGGVELKQVAGTDPQATVNALLDHQVDATSASLALDQVPPLEAGGFTIVSQPSDSSLILGPLCKSKPPFDNLKVRQALNYAIDRDEINDLIYQGTSEPLWAFWTQSSKLFNPKLEGLLRRTTSRRRRSCSRKPARRISPSTGTPGRRLRPRTSRDPQGAVGRGRDHREPGELHEHRPGVLHRAEGARRRDRR